MVLSTINMSVKIFFSILGILLAISTKEAACESNLEKILVDSEIIPDVINQAPKQEISVKFSNLTVNFGNELTPTQVQNQPIVKWGGEEDKYYTLAMVDPDAPSKQDPKLREVLHWLVGNIKNKDVSTGKHIAEYIGSGPPKGTGLHRYIFLLFKHNNNIEFNYPHVPKYSRKNRLNFSIKKFSEEYGLGQPVAINFYRAQWDEYVEIRNKNIKN